MEKKWEKYFLAGKNRNCIGNLTLLFFDPHFWFRGLIVRCTKNLRYELVDVKSRLLPIGNRLVFCPFYGGPRDHPRLPQKTTSIILRISITTSIILRIFKISRVKKDKIGIIRKLYSWISNDIISFKKYWKFQKLKVKILYTRIVKNQFCINWLD